MSPLPDLSVIVPLRAQNFDVYLPRIALRDALDLDGIEMLVVDDGSPPGVAASIAAFCAARGWTLVRLETGDVPFSLARSRNAGLQRAGASHVYMDDADLAYPREHFQRMAAQVARLDQTPFNFYSLPAVYLSEQASQHVLALGGLDLLATEIAHAVLLEDPKGSSDNTVVESFAPASGVLVMARATALAVGGYDESFEGWGGEDRDFVFRLLSVNSRLARPSRFSDTLATNLNDSLRFDGWRSLLKLHGDFLGRQGLWALHLHHQPLPWRQPESTVRNMRCAADKARSAPLTQLAPDAFDLRRCVLFEPYRAAELAGAGVELDEALTIKDRARYPVHSWRRKWQKLRVSPRSFLQDSRWPLLRAIARLVR